MGGSSVGGRLASAVLGPQLRRPFALAMGYDIPAWIGSETLVLCSSYSGTTEETRRHLRRGQARRRAAHRGHHRRPARRARPRRRRPGRPAPGRLPAPRRGRLLAGHRARGRRAVRRRALRARRRRRGRRRSRASSRAEWGPAGAEDSEAKRLARALAGTIPVITGAGPHRLGRLPLEVPDQRERGAPRVREQAARARPQRDRRLGRRGGPPRRDLPRGPRGRRARGAPHRGHGRDRGRRRRGRRARHGPHRLAARAAGLARPARRPRLALPRGAARHRPRARRGDRHA